VVLESYRERTAAYRARLARPFLKTSPAALTGIALGLAVLAGLLAFAVRFSTPILFVPVAFLIFASGVFDVLDGEVARSTGRTSRRGDFLDHVADRYADLAILAGITASGFVNPILALAALVSLLLTSYLGTLAQALGLGRLYGGLLTRADRLLLLAFVTFLEGDLSIPWPWAPTAPWSRLAVGGVPFTVLDLLMVYFLVAGQLTAAWRARTIYRALGSGAEAPVAPSRPR
jgi:archaetidylinositol phosphate synthase